MQLDNLTHWRLQGTPDVFTEMRDGHEWKIIHTGGATHRAGFMQLVQFERPIETATLWVWVSFYSPGGDLSLRVGIDPSGNAGPNAEWIQWGNWYTTRDEKQANMPARLIYHVKSLNTDRITVFLESQCNWKVRANTSRWRDVQLEVEYLDTDPEPDPDPEPGIPGQIAALQAEITAYYDQISICLAKIDALIVQWNEAQAWVDNYNSNLEV